MGVSRVDFAGETLVDLTSDTVTPQSLLSGYSAHNKAGELIEGLAVIPAKVSELENDSKFITETGDSSKTTVTFEQAENRANIFSKDSLKTIMGKISKMYSDLKTVAFSGKYTDLEGRVTVTNNDLATIPGTAWDAVRGAQIRKDLDKLYSDFLDASVGIEIADPMSAHDIWVRISEAQWWQITTIRKIVITDANHIILSHNGYWLGTIAINAGNVTGVLVNHWTGEAVTIRASAYQTDSISFATL